MDIISDFILPCARMTYRTIARFLTFLFSTAINIFYLISWLLSSSSDTEISDVPEPEDEEKKHPVKAVGWAARDTSGVLSPFKFSRRATRENDVQFKVLYCGICHSDLHQIKNELGSSTYPIVPGHEIVGVVTAVGSTVRKVKVGDKVGVGCMVGSCRKCEHCVNNEENCCPQPIYTYLSVDTDGTRTYGGYSNIMVADEHFIIRWPENLPLASGAPLLCAGSTTYSSLKYYRLDKPGLHIGIVGLGGLGHVAVMFAKAFGAEVTVISSSASKKEDAIETFGADAFVLSQDSEEMKAMAGTMDGIIDTVPAVHPIEPLISLLKPHGKLVVIGVAEKLELPASQMVGGGKIVGGSLIAGLKETQEMIDFAAEHDLVPMVEIIPMDYVNKAMERLAEGDVMYRFVIDVGKTLKAE